MNSIEPVMAPSKSPPTGITSTPSRFYNAQIWRAGLSLARRLPPSSFANLAQGIAQLYQLCAPARRRVVFHNLLPVLNGDASAAETSTSELFDQFAIKLTDLWRYESGISIHDLFHDLTGWEHFQTAQRHGRGVLFLTIHLGNWEFGAPLLTDRGIKLQVVTLAEPQAQLTSLRQQARSRWGVDTIALGSDPFASVEIIRRLEENNAVALLVDRPPPATATPVTLFDQPFSASVAAAELARASGCALLPVYLPRTPQGYVAHLLPEIPYERRALRDPQARTHLTQQIMSAFQPAIRQYLNQWYHFVPIWSDRSH